MRKSIYIIGLALVFAARLGLGQTNSYPPQLATFTDAKEHQAQRIARERHMALPPEAKKLFEAAHCGDYLAMSNIVAGLGQQLYAGYRSFPNGDPAWLPFFQVMNEVESGYSYFTHHAPMYLWAFADGIIQSIPPGSIYFGGTDQGRLLVTALCASHVEGKPFYTLTQNALADDRYMTYLRGMYDKTINLPTTNDVNQVLEEYNADALRRLKHDEQFPNEPHQHVQGEVAVMAMNGRLLKWILDHNPKPEFYYEESFPLELLYSRLVPHGLIFKLNHEPLAMLPASDMDADHVFWTKQFGKMLGDWLKPDTSVSNLCFTVETLYREKDLSRFTGDPAFLTNGFAPKSFSKLRVSIAGLYQWRLMNDRTKRLSAEADYAFRQAYALCPTSPEALYRYINFLLTQSRIEDAILIVHTSLRLTPADDPIYNQYENLMMQLKQYREQPSTAGSRR